MAGVSLGCSCDGATTGGVSVGVSGSGTAGGSWLGRGGIEMSDLKCLVN